MIAWRRDHAPYRWAAGHGNCDIGRTVITGESQGDSCLLAGMELVDDIAVALLGILERLQARHRAMNSEMNCLKIEVLPTPLGA